MKDVWALLRLLQLVPSHAGLIGAMVVCTDTDVVMQDHIGRVIRTTETVPDPSQPPTLQVEPSTSNVVQADSAPPMKSLPQPIPNTPQPHPSIILPFLLSTELDYIPNCAFAYIH